MPCLRTFYEVVRNSTFYKGITFGEGDILEALSRSHKSRLAIRAFKVIADALVIRGHYKPSGVSGQTLANALKDLSPEIYGTMNDPRSIEITGLEYVLDRLPRGLEDCIRIVLTASEAFEQTSFEKIVPNKRRRLSYRISEDEMCFVITTGLSEIYDVLTHITFLNIEAEKIYHQMKEPSGEYSSGWKDLEHIVASEDCLADQQLDQAIWNLSIILGRTYQETRDTYYYLNANRKSTGCSNSLFQIIYRLGKRVERENASKDNELLIYFTPSLQRMIGHHTYGPSWASAIKEKICTLGLQDRPLHIISANMHSVLNLLYGYAAVFSQNQKKPDGDLYLFLQKLRDDREAVRKHAESSGCHYMPDSSGTLIDAQIMDLALLDEAPFHPDLHIERENLKTRPPVLLVMDYAFGTQAYEVMDELLSEFHQSPTIHVASISVMGKAGILPGKKGDIMLPTAHVMEGTPHNYLVKNDLKAEDFDASIDVYVGPIVTVLGTSLQNRDVLEKFQTTSWKAIGLEMEGGHYQRAISAAIIRGHISPNIKVRYAYYASDNPLVSGQTLASGSMGDEGIKPTYMITKVIIEKILNDSDIAP
jgi:hypothetical protein